MDWNWANSWLQGGRKKYIRPLYDRGLYLWKTDRSNPNSDICVGWKNTTPFITYHHDGTTTIGIENTGASWYWPSLRSYSVRFSIMRYANVHDVYQKNFKFYVVDNNYTKTPPKIQGCRTCKSTGKVDEYCGPSTCWQGNLQATPGGVVCTEHGMLDPQVLSMNGRWHTVACEHGNEQAHTIPKGRDCYYCNGTGKRDYGSKKEALQWDGSPLRLRDGNVIKKAASMLERMVKDYVQPVG